ncbi:MAG: trigger factor [Methylococcales bacterium]
MQVSVEQTSELKRKMKVQVPEETIQSECAKRIDSLARQANIKGFRPGKIPIGVIRKRFGVSVRNEVVSEMIRSSLFDAFKSHEIRPAGAPHIESTVNEAGKGLEFEASFEVYPHVEIQSFNKLNIVLPVCEITESDIDRMIENLRQQHRSWRVVERQAIGNDRLTVSYAVSVNGEVSSDCRIDDRAIEIGHNQMIAGFEQNLIGLRPGDEKVFMLSFPDDYYGKDYAGKPAEFKLKVHKVEEAVLADLDQEFFKQFGVASGETDEFRRSLRESIEFEKNKAIWFKTKQAVADALLEAHALAVPEVIVNQQIEELQKQHTASHPGCDSEHPGHRREDYESQARRFVKLALLFNEIANRHQIKADPSRVRKLVENLLQGSDAPDEVVKSYYANPERMKAIESLVLEDQVVEWILKQANVQIEPIDYVRLTTFNPSSVETNHSA